MAARDADHTPAWGVEQLLRKYTGMRAEDLDLSSVRSTPVPGGAAVRVSARLARGIDVDDGLISTYRPAGEQVHAVVGDGTSEAEAELRTYYGMCSGE